MENLGDKSKNYHGFSGQKFHNHTHNIHHTFKQIMVIQTKHFLQPKMTGIHFITMSIRHIGSHDPVQLATDGGYLQLTDGPHASKWCVRSRFSSLCK